MAEAYGVKDHDVFGPPWIDAERFEIVAKVAPETAKLTDAQRYAAIRAMAQRLLAHRFHLETHRETRDMPVYVLVPAKGGVKLKESGPPSDDWVRAAVSSGKIAAQQMPMAQLLSILGGILQREVLDQSGIHGMFDISLEFSPDESAPAPGVVATARPSLFTAMQEQAGLKLESRKVPIQVLVVDRAERPEAN